MMLIEGIITLQVSELFPGAKSDFQTFKSLLSGLNRTQTLNLCAGLNILVSLAKDGENWAKQQAFIRNFLTPKERNTLANWISAQVSQEKDIQRVHLIYRGQLLELLRWVVLLCPDDSEAETTFTNPEARSRFMQAALIAGSLWEDRVFRGKFSLNTNLTITHERELETLIGSLRKAGEGVIKVPRLDESLGRGWLLFRDYFPDCYASFEHEFRTTAGLGVEEYYIYMAAMIGNLLNPIDLSRRVNAFNSNLLWKTTPYSEIFERHLINESQTVNGLRDALWGNVKEINNYQEAPTYDYRPLREKPVVRTQEGHCVIVDPYFFNEKASIGPLFLLKDREKAFTSFGTAFEKYACDILKRMFPDISEVLTKRLSCDVRGTYDKKDLQIDACLNDMTEVVLFEMKAKWIREDKILADNDETYPQHLRDKYSTDQLARVIKLIADKKWLGTNLEFSEAKIIYPVLVVHDVLMTEPTCGAFLAAEFERFLQPESKLASGELLKGHLRVAPLTVMAVDELENLEASVEHFGFRTLLADYSQSSPDRFAPLRNFIASSKYKQHMYANEFNSREVFELYRKVNQALLP
jgi:hypothetical protein